MLNLNIIQKIILCDITVFGTKMKKCIKEKGIFFIIIINQLDIVKANGLVPSGNKPLSPGITCANVDQDVWRYITLVAK